MRRFTLFISVLFLVLAAVPATAAKPFPDTIDLPDGYFPEGIAVGKGSTFYVGSLADGSIYKGDLRTGQGEVLTDPAGPFATVGIEVDNKERIWVAGGPSGTGRVYDGRTGALLETYVFSAPFASFVNDVVVTNDAAYFTDSGTANDPDPSVFRFAGEPRLFVVPLGAGKSLPHPSAVQTLPTNLPDVDFPNLNGIETTPGGSSLVIAHTSAQALFTVDPATGLGTQTDLGGTDLQGADGLIRRGTTVYIVENAAGQISAVKIEPDGSAGVVTNTYPVVGAETPTTAGLFGNALYTVDARFVSMAGPYQVFRVELR